MIGAAAHALAHELTDAELARGLLYPRIARLRDVTGAVADAVMRQAGKEGVGEALDETERRKRLETNMWVPHYQPYVPV